MEECQVFPKKTGEPAPKSKSEQKRGKCGEGEKE